MFERIEEALLPLDSYNGRGRLQITGSFSVMVVADVVQRLPVLVGCRSLS